MRSATRRVERMNHHRRKHRTPRIRPRWERWADLISATGLGIISGPFPGDADGEVPLSTVDEEELRWTQSRLGVLVDGVLGPQSWAAVAADNDAVRAMDPSPQRRPGMAGALSLGPPRPTRPSAVHG
jgi:hypothetical protein